MLRIAEAAGKLRAIAAPKPAKSELDVAAILKKLEVLNGKLEKVPDGPDGWPAQIVGRCSIAAEQPGPAPRRRINPAVMLPAAHASAALQRAPHA